MNDELRNRLNSIESIITSDKFLNSRGLGNELAFFIFDYPAEEELAVREYIHDLLVSLSDKLKIAHYSLFELIIDYLKQRGLLAKTLEVQRKDGDTAVLKALKGSLHESKIAVEFVKVIKPEEQNIVILTGIGSSWPLIRTHTLLNALQPLMKNTPLIVFYPGKFDGQSFQLFDRVGSGSYYRAFQLVP